MSLPAKTQEQSQFNGISARELLRDCRIDVAPETFTLLSFGHAEFARLLQDSAISPRGSSPFLIFADAYEVTVLLAEDDLCLVRPFLGEARVEGGFRLLTFDIVLDFDVVGFLAEVSKILSDAAVPIFGISAFSRDHLLIKQDDLARALAVLGDANDELC